MLHSYRHRFGNVAGDRAYDATEAKLARQPHIGVPTVSLVGASGEFADDPEQAPRSSGRFRAERLPGIGHNIPQEAPEAFARAVLDVA